MVNGEKKKCQYLRDNGVSIYRDMSAGDKIIGVSCVQKGSKIIKTADYPNLVWVSKTIVKNTDTDTDYPHKEGKFQIIEGDEAKNVRLMVVRE
jgi:hypothetical protein